MGTLSQKIIAAATAFLAQALIGCASADAPKDADGGERLFKSLGWESEKDGTAMVGQEVWITASAPGGKIEDGEPAVIKITAAHDGNDIDIDEIEASVTGGKIRARWTVKDSPEFFDGGGYVVPKYSFTVEVADGESEKSPELSVYGFIAHRLVGSDGKAKAGEKFVVKRTDGKTIEGKRDKNGTARLEWLPLGKYEISRLIEKTAGQIEAEKKAAEQESENEGKDDGSKNGE